MLLKTKDLIALGYSPWLIRGIKTAGTMWGDNPFVGGRYAYEEDLKAWLRRHPEFIASREIRSSVARRRQA